MLAAAAMAASLAMGAHACAPDLRLNAEQLERRLDAAALSPVSVRAAERACLAKAAGRMLALDKLAEALLPGVPEDLALGRADLYQGLTGRLRARCPEAGERPKACGKARVLPPAPEPPTPIDQTEQGFILWQRVEPGRARQVKAFRAFLLKRDLMTVAPFYQLLRTASDWKTCGGEPFAVAPAEDWPRAARTLAWIAARVKPAIGPVEVMSGYRDADLNACAGGAKSSAHLGFWALDLEPVNPTLDRPQVMNLMCQVHADHGSESDIGLGFYGGVRFHVDDERFRHWGFDTAAAPACAWGVAPAPAA